MWIDAASEIVNEQALEERAHPSMIPDAPVCLCYYRMFALLTPILVLDWLGGLVAGCLHNPRRAGN